MCIRDRGYPWLGKEEERRALKLRVALASTFSASLELSRQQMLQADQRGQFEEIILLGAL